MSNLANKLREKREKKGLKQEDIANLFNVSRTTYTNWENGRHEPDINHLIQIADFFEISLDHLVGRYEK